MEEIEIKSNSVNYKKITFCCSPWQQEILFEMSEAFSVATKVVIEFCLFYKLGINSKKTLRSARLQKPLGKHVTFNVDEEQYYLILPDEERREKISSAISDTYRDWKCRDIDLRILYDYFPHI